MEDKCKNVFEIVDAEKKARLKTPVLLEFFNRPDTFVKVFEQVKKVRPEVLFLYQDGMRNIKQDEEGYDRCRTIALGIDWNCKVYTFFQEKNCGCDPSGFIAQQWAFSNADRCIVLEDDCVPNLSFFYFCEELLEKYKDDEKINIICGMNNLGEWKREKASYFFGRRGSIWGWASWSRVVLDWQKDYKWIDNKAYMKQLEETWKPCRNWKSIEKRWKYCASTGRQYFEVLMGERLLRRNALNIIPSVNMMQNIGEFGGTHSDMSLKMYPKFYRRWMVLESHEMEQPMRHPEKVAQDVVYDRKMDPNPIQSLLIRPERIFLQIRYGNWDKLCQKLITKIKNIWRA